MDSDVPGIKGYGQYCPITRAVEVLGERWTFMIVRDLLTGSTRFNELARGLPRLSRTLLSTRLRQLEAAGIVERLDDRYLLTPAGQELEPIVFGLGAWGAKWQFGDPREDELDSQLLMWWVHRRLNFGELPDRRIVLQFAFSDDPRQYWILKDREGPSVCDSDPGFDVDALVHSDLRTLYRVWLGKEPLQRAVMRGALVIDGPPAIVRRMPLVMALSEIAPAVAVLQA